MIRMHCPVCRREMGGERPEWPQFPFCSPRCKTIDLGRWLGERGYGVPVERGEETDDASQDERELS